MALPAFMVVVMPDSRSLAKTDMIKSNEDMTSIFQRANAGFEEFGDAPVVEMA